MRSRRARATSSRASPRVARALKNTHLDLGRLEGGDAADEGGSEEGRHCRTSVLEWRERARARARSRVALARSIARALEPRRVDHARRANPNASIAIRDRARSET